MFLLIHDFFWFFFSFPRFTHQPRSLPQKCCESSKFRPSDGAARLFSFPKKRWAISRHWFHEIFWLSHNCKFSCFFGYIFINCKYYKKSNRYCTFWTNWAVTENVCNYISIFCFHIFIFSWIIENYYMCNFWIQKKVSRFFCFL